MHAMTDKGKAKIIRWLQRTANKDRDDLKGVHHNPTFGGLEACNGFVYHAAQVEIITTHEMEILEAKYRDTSACCPSGEIKFEIAIDAALLVKALQGLDGLTCLRFYGPDRAVELYGKIDGIPVYAAIMPMQLTRANALTWRPYKNMLAQKEAE